MYIYTTDELYKDKFNENSTIYRLDELDDNRFFEEFDRYEYGIQMFLAEIGLLKSSKVYKVDVDIDNTGNYIIVYDNSTNVILYIIKNFY